MESLEFRQVGVEDLEYLGYFAGVERKYEQSPCLLRQKALIS